MESGGDESERTQHLDDADNLDWQAYRSLSLRPHGFGQERIRIWPLLVHVDPHAPEDRREPSGTSIWSETTLEQTLDEPDLTLEGEPHKDERQIELDTNRSFVLYPVEDVNNREKLQAALNQLIVSIFRRRPRLHYFQGYHDIVSVVLLTLPKELHLPVTEKLSLHRIRDSMGVSLDPVVGLLRSLKRLLRLVDPQFAATLDRTAPLPYFALSNLLTLFSHDVPTLPLIQHIFDYLLCRPPIAVVYLAAAVTLTRRQEVQVLEDEGEEGMVHSLLTVFPDLYEEDGWPTVAKAKEQSELSSPTLTQVEAAEHIDNGTDTPPASDQESVQDITLDDPQTAIGGIPVVANAQCLSPDAPQPDVQEPSIVLKSIAAPGARLVAEPAVKVKPSDIPLPESEDETPWGSSSLEPLEHEARPHRPRVSMTALLTHADDLFVLYPPSHPELALSSIMGPQSVMLTWSERPSDLPDDDEAELMITHPELIVLPYVEQESKDEGAESEKRRRDKDERDRRRRRLRKPRRLTDIVVQRKTMVAGAVLVLGVAMAVYGLNGGMPGVGSGHQKSGFGKELKKVGKLLGGVVGVGGRVWEGLRHGLV